MEYSLKIWKILSHILYWDDKHEQHQKRKKNMKIQTKTVANL